MAEKIITIGAGKMGSLIAGESAISLRQTESFTEVLNGSDLVLLATRQKDGLRWLRINSSLLSGKTVISLMAFVDFETLQTAVDNQAVRLVRIMTDTSLDTISWSDDGFMNNQRKKGVAKSLAMLGETKYLGIKADQELLLETIKACQLGWLAQALDELTSGVDEEVLVKVFGAKTKGLELCRYLSDGGYSRGSYRSRHHCQSRNV